MLNSKRLVLVLLSVLLIAMVILSGCGSSQSRQPTAPGNGSSSSEQNSGQSSTSEDTLSGTITAAGSTAMQPLVEKAAARFMELHPNVTITVQGGGSGTGLSQVANGAVDIGNSDVFAEEKLGADQAKELVDHQVIAQGFAAIVNKDVQVDSLTKQQLIDIFTGKVTNWKDVGGQDLKIVVVNRPTSSGTRVTFIAKALDGAQVIEGNTLTEDSNGTVLATVAQQPGAISYLGLAYLDESVKALKIDGVEPTVENIVAGTYPVWSFGHMYTKGEPKEPVKSFLDFMTSDDVAQIAKKLNYIAGSDAAKLK
ncbi:phosphate ABC transporter substrate-binding protein [Calorimonas adulescens]|jgi:phosphate ABC transporter substrate-binding protein, PhoT family (TC 3.A.1.7.1)|uniref:Phosphate-binding protein n=1 Tax=Calorimonas adulescens TaxID=2606906 RepID=A0A5D8QDQ1_9THEO|nr:phosphate ABC transporter substrate-binding protein [Calorimonas adulescens]TZE81966.1 phosphate ABC transporter substrate-binding protein [Calorimonas adulescens]